MNNNILFSQEELDVIYLALMSRRNFFQRVATERPDDRAAQTNLQTAKELLNKLRTLNVNVA